MNVTEEAAKEKWCPFVKVQTENLSAHRNRYGMADDGAVSLKPVLCCIGSRCMMWDWYSYKLEYLVTERTVASAQQPDPPPVNQGWERDPAQLSTKYKAYWRRITDQGVLGYCTMQRR